VRPVIVVAVAAAPDTDVPEQVEHDGLGFTV
jgi:hypothetical protein